MPQTTALLNALADGRFHSGQELGKALGVSRTAVWKQLKRMERQFGLSIHAVQGRGYRLAAPLELLEHDAILAQLPMQAHGILHGLEIHLSIDSTNRHLMRRAAEGVPGGLACLAERQEAGRGRHGRQWCSPFGTNLYLSLLWRSPMAPAQLGGLSLAVGAAVVHALGGAGVQGIGLKWPNDLLWAGRKLGGVLLEVAGESSGPCQVVAGVGLNLRMDHAAAADIDQPWANLEETAGRALSRNAVAGTVLGELLITLDGFAGTGLAPYLTRWREHDVLCGKPVRLSLPDRQVEGIARGVDEDGALLLESPEGLERYSIGEASLRQSKATA